MNLLVSGDGVGKGSHVSLYFVVMRGDYDGILSWPFAHKVNSLVLKLIILNTFDYGTHEDVITS